jgi:tRNA(fMet)-specific endonuclease VapC
MIRYMLDTSLCVELLRGRAGAVEDRLRKLRVGEVAISTIALAELEYGAAKSKRPEHHRELLVKFCAPLAVVPFDTAASEQYGRVRTFLEGEGTPIGPLDTLIASHALSLGTKLITGNEDEFRRVPGLAVENWLRQAEPGGDRGTRSLTGRRTIPSPASAPRPRFLPPRAP